MIKSAKKAIKAILSTADVTDEELQLAFIGAEALINSRPLTYQSADPTDHIPLTLNHFLVGQLGGKFSPKTIDDAPFNPRKQWHRVQELIGHFWDTCLKAGVLNRGYLYPLGYEAPKQGVQNEASK